MIKNAYLDDPDLNDPEPTASDPRRVLESWATGVEIYLTRMFYRRMGASNYEYLVETRNGQTAGNYQNRMITETSRRIYTSVIWDLVDDFNQSSGFGKTISAFPKDQASGFTMPQLEACMHGAKSWNSLRDKVLEKNRQLNQVKDQQQEEINELFANW